MPPPCPDTPVTNQKWPPPLMLICQSVSQKHECACVCGVFGNRQYAGVVFQLCNVSPDVT